MGRVAGTVAVVAHRHRHLPARNRLRHGHRRLVGPGVAAHGELLPHPPHEFLHVAGDLVRQRLVAVGHDVYGGAHVGHVRPGEPVEHAHVGVVLARLPAPGPLHDVHRGRLAGPLQDGRGDDPRSAGRGRGPVLVAGRQPQRPRRALALDIGVVVGKALGDEGEVGVLQELAVLVAVQVERPGDGHPGADHLAEAPRDLRLGAGHVPHRHGAMQCEVDRVDGQLFPQLGKHGVHEVVEGLLRVPAPGRSAEDSDRRGQRHQLDVPEFARPLREAADVVPRRQQRLPRERLAVAQPVLDFGVAARAEGAGLMLEGRDGEAQTLRLPGRLGAGRPRRPAARRRREKPGSWRRVA